MNGVLQKKRKFVPGCDRREDVAVRIASAASAADATTTTPASSRLGLRRPRLFALLVTERTARTNACRLAVRRL